MTWKLDDHTAVHESDTLKASFDVHNPKAGLQSITFASESLLGLNPLQVTAAPPVSKETIIESYVRKESLVATYAQLPERTVRPQLCLRSLSSSELATAKQIAGIELVISVQTSLLDSDPTFSALTSAAAKEVYGLSFDQNDWPAVDTSSERELPADQFAGAFVFRMSDCDVSYAELIFPTDFQGARLTGGNSAALSYQLFPEFLEKGVIRKGRIWAVIMDRGNDLELAKACFEQMLASPPPLTV